jgi:flagellar basal-body rod protein FlgG
VCKKERNKIGGVIMNRALSIASSGMQAQQFNLDVIANNLANVNTDGFKKSRADFQSLFYQSLQKPTVSSTGGTSSFGIEVGSGVRVAGTRTDFSTGIIQQTQNNLDLAIEGGGFFMVQLPDGKAGFTRGGAFRLDNEGFLVNADGYKVLSDSGNESPENSISVGDKDLKYIKPDTANGTVNIGTNGTISTEKDVSSPPVLNMALITNPEGLEAVGSTCYTATDVAGTITVGQPATEEYGVIRAGFLEASNVQVVDEMVKMIVAQRAYEIGSKAIQTSDEMMGMTNSLKR